LRAIIALAGVTVRESLRQKLAVNLLVFALLLIGASITISQVTFGEQYRIIADLALTAAQLFGTLIAVFVGASLVAGDIARRTLYPVIAKPISRPQYILGRYLGLVFVLTLNLLVMATTMVAVMAVYLHGFRFLAGPLIPALTALAAQLAVVGAIAVFFSTLTNTTLAAIFSLCVTFAGHFSRDVVVFWRDNPLLRAVGFALPHLSALDFKVQVVYQQAIPSAQLGLALLYALLYASVALALSSAIFASRDLR
jgi:ABC-type transport system involved in multi-copper enzyme maturation permease subunit